MKTIIKAINSYYNNEITQDEFLELLDSKPQEDLVEFIMEMQARNCFGRGICHK